MVVLTKEGVGTATGVAVVEKVGEFVVETLGTRTTGDRLAVVVAEGVTVEVEDACTAVLVISSALLRQNMSKSESGNKEKSVSSIV